MLKILRVCSTAGPLQQGTHLIWYFHSGTEVTKEESCHLANASENSASLVWGCVPMKDDNCFRQLWMGVDTNFQSLHRKMAGFWVRQQPVTTWESFERSVLFMCCLFILLDGNKLLKEIIKGLGRKAFYRRYCVGALIGRASISHAYHHWEDENHNDSKKSQSKLI